VLLEEEVDEDGDVLAALAQGRHVDGEDVDAVVEVVAEAPVRDHRAQVAVGRRDDAHVYLDGARAADAANLALLQRAQKLRLHRHVQLAYLVEEERPAVGYLEEPLLLGVRAGERALLVAEEFGFEQVLVDGGAVDGLEHLRDARRLAVDGARDEFLARARLAADEDRRVRARDLENHLLDRLHLGRGGDDLLVQGVELGERAADGLQKRLALEGLFEVVECAAAERLLGRLDGAVRGEQQDDDGGVEGEELREQLDAVHARHLQVGEREVEASLARDAQRRLARRGRRHVVALARQNHLQNLALRLLVVNDQDAFACHSL
jgi:hypothetical protein